MKKKFNVIDLPGHVNNTGYPRVPAPTAETQEPELSTDTAGNVIVQFDYGTEALSICRIMGERKQEIADNKNGYTTNPIYVVYESGESISSSDDFQIGTSKFSQYQNDHYRRYTESGESFIRDTDAAWPKDANNDEHVTIDDITYQEVVRCGIHDIFVTVFLTRAAAELFIEREKHNLTDPRIWVDSVPRRNLEMREIITSLDAIADKVDSAIQLASSSNG